MPEATREEARKELSEDWPYSVPAHQRFDPKAIADAVQRYDQDTKVHTHSVARQALSWYRGLSTQQVEALPDELRQVARACHILELHLKAGPP